MVDGRAILIACTHNSLYITRWIKTMPCYTTAHTAELPTLPDSAESSLNIINLSKVWWTNLTISLIVETFSALYVECNSKNLPDCKVQMLAALTLHATQAQELIPFSSMLMQWTLFFLLLCRISVGLGLEKIHSTCRGIRTPVYNRRILPTLAFHCYHCVLHIFSQIWKCIQDQVYSSMLFQSLGRPIMYMYSGVMSHGFKKQGFCLALSFCFSISQLWVVYLRWLMSWSILGGVSLMLIKGQ